MFQTSKKVNFLILFTINILLGLIIGTIFFYRDSRSNSFIAAAADKKSVLNEDEIRFAERLQDVYRKIATQNIPAVVNISVEMVVVQRNPFEDFMGDDDIFRFFFGQPRREQKRRAQSMGSGFIISKDGYLISNFHVINNATRIIIKVSGREKEYEAEIVGTDPDMDIALLKIKDKEEFDYVILGDSDKMQIGDIVTAIGNPFGLMSTFTTGVISATGRSQLGINRYENYLQSDVAINPGNSGGPMINIFGEVVGVNTAIYSQSGGSIGIGFAIPINMIKNVIEDLKNKGKVERGYLGVGIQDIDEELAKTMDIKPEGAYITQVGPGSPAEKAGMQVHDIITEFDGKKVMNTGDLRNFVIETKPGNKVPVIVLRAGKTVKLSAVIEVLKEEDQIASAEEKNDFLQGKFLGLKVMPLTDEVRRMYRIEDTKGVLIGGIDANSPLSRTDVSRGDIILEINGKKTDTIDQFISFARENDKTKRFRFMLKRGNMIRMVGLNLK